MASWPFLSARSGCWLSLPTYWIALVAVRRTPRRLPQRRAKLPFPGGRRVNLPIRLHHHFSTYFYSKTFKRGKIAHRLEHSGFWYAHTALFAPPRTPTARARAQDMAAWRGLTHYHYQRAKQVATLHTAACGACGSSHAPLQGLGRQTHGRIHFTTFLLLSPHVLYARLPRQHDSRTASATHTSS